MSDDVCSVTTTCKRPVALTYLGSSMCQHHWELKCKRDERNETPYEGVSFQSSEDDSPLEVELVVPPINNMKLVEAAEIVLKDVGTAMLCSCMISQMAERGLWISRARTPDRTLYSTMLRDMDKNSNSVFERVGPSTFKYRRPEGVVHEVLVDEER